MLRVIVRRLAMAIPLLVAVAAVVFLLESIVPGDAARSIVGRNGTHAEYEAVRRQLHLNEPVLQQFWDYLKGLAHGSLGNSLFTGASVTSTLGPRVPVTLSLIVLGTVSCSTIGILMGIFSVVRGGMVARFLDVLSLVGLALPTFWVALVLVEIFSESLHWLPSTGYVSFGTSPGQWIQSLVLPVITLILGWIASVAKQTRASMLEVLDRDFIRTLRASGISERSIVFRHALRSAMGPVLTVIGLFIVSSLSATVVVETVFSMPGLGGEVVLAASQHDVPVIEGVALYFTVVVLIVNALVDIGYAWLTPRVRVR